MSSVIVIGSRDSVAPFSVSSSTRKIIRFWGLGGQDYAEGNKEMVGKKRVSLLGGAGKTGPANRMETIRDVHRHGKNPDQ